MGARIRLSSQNHAKSDERHIKAKLRILEAVTHKNFKRNTIVRGEILACAIGREKNVAALESCEMARVAYFGQITNIGSGRVRKL